MTEGRTPSSILVIAGSPRTLVNFRGLLLGAMRTSGHRVDAAAPGLTDNRAVATSLQRIGISLHDIPLSRTGLNPFTDGVLFVALVRLMRIVRPDVVFAYTIKSVIFGLMAAAIAGVPRRYALITGLGYAFTGEAAGKRRVIQSIARALYRMSLRRATKVFFQNPDDAALFRRLGLVPTHLPTIVVNGSGIDLNQFRPAPLPSGPIHFLLIARLLSAKGIREYATAAEAIRAIHPDVEFHLVGGFDSNPDAIPASEVNRWQRDEILVWHGEVDDVRPFIASAHVYVLPSYREGTPRSVLEAMAMARPVITTDAPGCRETVIDGENGFLVPPGTVEPLTQAMARFIDDPELIERTGRKSRQLAESRYDVHAVNRRMLEEMELV